jgi:hypothetical protein
MKSGPLMSMRYFKLPEYVYVPGRWELGILMGTGGEELGSPVFLRGGVFKEV